MSQAIAPLEISYPPELPVTQRREDIAAAIRDHQVVVVAGETGSGKTTVAKLVTRLMDPTGGQVLLDGTDLRRLTLGSLRERVVLVPQEGFLFDGTVAQNVAYGLRDDGADGAADRVAEAVAASKALCTSGRARVTVRTSPSRSTRTGGPDTSRGRGGRLAASHERCSAPACRAE